LDLNKNLPGQDLTIFEQDQTKNTTLGYSPETARVAMQKKICQEYLTGIK